MDKAGSPTRSASADTVAGRILDATKAPSAEQLLAVYEHFGGAEGLLADEDYSVKYLAGIILKSENFPSDEYRKLLDATRLNRYNVYPLAHHKDAHRDYAVFQKLWKGSKETTWMALESSLDLDGALIPDGIYEIISPCGEADCSRENHEGCRGLGIYHADLARRHFEKERARILAELHPSILPIIHRDILSMTVYARKLYARSLIIAEDHWEKLLLDRRSLVTELADNSILPTAIAEKILAKHSTPDLRISIATQTESKELLEQIWNETKSNWNGMKSKAIRERVAFNALSRRHLTDLDS